MPFRVTVAPSGTVRSGPASTTGGRLADPVTDISRTRWLLVPKPPVEVTLTVYAGLSGTASKTRFVPVILKEAESPPVPIPYTGFCPSRMAFWDEMVPTTPGASPASMAVLLGTTYQPPKFCSKKRAPANISVMFVAEETSQGEMSWLKEKAPANIQPMLVTLETFQEEMSWLKEKAS